MEMVRRNAPTFEDTVKVPESSLMVAVTNVESCICRSTTWAKGTPRPSSPRTVPCIDTWAMVIKGVRQKKRHIGDIRDIIFRYLRKDGFLKNENNRAGSCCFIVMELCLVDQHDLFGKKRYLVAVDALGNVADDLKFVG